MKKLFSLLTAILFVGSMWGTDTEASLTLSSDKKFGTTSGSTLTDTEGNTWTCVGSDIQNQYQSSYSGQQFGTSKTNNTYTFTCTIPGATITSVSATMAAGNSTPTYDISVGGSSKKSGSLSTTSTKYTTGTISATGEICITMDQNNASKAVYLGKIEISYVESDCTAPTTALSITSANTVTLGNTLSLTSNGGNGGAIVWSVVNGTGSATLEGTTLTPVSRGTVTVTATQAENTISSTTYCGAAPTQTITISRVAPSPIAGGMVDELQVSTFGVDGGYTAFTNAQASNSGHSNAVYAGTVARNGKAAQYNIQLNSGTTNEKLREIVTSTSGGFAKRVYVTWATQSDNTNGRKLTVYGSHDAYTGSETEATGTEIGDIVFSTGDAFEYLDIAADYEYIQIVANNAIYMDQIDITWIPATYAINFSAPEHGTLKIYEDDLETLVVSGSKYAVGTELYVDTKPDSGYKLDGVKVIKTGSDPEEIVTGTVYDEGLLIIPAYGVTVSATFSQATALEDVESSAKAVKVLRNGVLYIEKAGKTYNAQGQLVK